MTCCSSEGRTIIYDIFVNLKTFYCFIYYHYYRYLRIVLPSEEQQVIIRRLCTQGRKDTNNGKNKLTAQ